MSNAGPSISAIGGFLNGNQAIARAAAETGLHFFSHYPGSPVNFVEPELRKLDEAHGLDIRFNDSLNEHVAALSAMGAAYCGGKAMVVMKHVGLNIAADPFNFAGYTGIKGQLVIIVGTDPGANSSTGEEDVHWYAGQFNFPLLEPVNVSGIYSTTLRAFELSGELQLPVMIFVPGALCNSIDAVTTGTIRKADFSGLAFGKDPSAFINVGEKAVKNHRRLVEKMERFGKTASGFCASYFNPNAETLLVTRGATFPHVYETVMTFGLQEKVSLVNIALVHPIPETEFSAFLAGKQQIIFIEDQDGFVEMMVKMRLFNQLNATVSGKDIFPAWGAVTLSQVRQALAKQFGLEAIPSPALPEVPERLGTFCEGCPHTASFYSIDQVLKKEGGIIGGDIGCSSLPPFRADWLLCMNAGIGVSQGVAQVSTQPIVSTGGDGSFFHGGLLSLMSAVHNKLDLIHLVFDNRYIAMTGHQDSPSSAASFDHRKLLESIGVDRIYNVSAFDPQHFIPLLEEEKKRKGVRVFWVSGACALRPDEARIEKRKRVTVRIDNGRCGSCTKCYTELACPAIQQPDPAVRDLLVDPQLCSRCGACKEICPNNAVIHDLAPGI